MSAWGLVCPRLSHGECPSPSPLGWGDTRAESGGVKVSPPQSPPGPSLVGDNVDVLGGSLRVGVDGLVPGDRLALQEIVVVCWDLGPGEGTEG